MRTKKLGFPTMVVVGIGLERVVVMGKKVRKNEFGADFDNHDSNRKGKVGLEVDIENQIDIFHTLSVTNIPNFPVEDFFKVPFTHHSAIISGTKS